MKRAPSILVVEDDPDLLALVEMFLAESGRRVRTAPEGRAALARVAEEMPGLILLDMRMPVMNGWEFAREFRARYGRACPIVVVTAYGPWSALCGTGLSGVGWTVIILIE